MKKSDPRVRPVARTSLAETAYDSILDAILTGRLPVGEEVSEVSLAADLGISRTPVAQAVRRLASSGLIERPAGKPPRVAKFQRDDVVEIYQMRMLLESESAFRAATRMAGERLEALADDIAWLTANPTRSNWADRALQFDIRFHDEIALASGSRRLCDHVRQYRLLVRAFCRSTGRNENLKDALEEHRRILKALAARDGDKARAAMADHIRRRMDVVVAELYSE